MTSDQRRAVELISIAEGGASLTCEHTLRGNVHVKVAGHSWAVGADDAVTIIRPDGRITDYAALEYELSPEGQRDLCDHHRRCAEAEAPDLLPEIHDVTDLDTDRDTERAADEPSPPTCRPSSRLHLGPRKSPNCRWPRCGEMPQTWESKA